MLITLSTDFGYKDPFVGIMKGVIAGINPQARVIDLSHGIPPQDTVAAALVLRQSVAYFPRGTIHVAVVDPGVGSERRPLLIESDEHYFIGPDNGVLSLALGEQAPRRIIHLTKPTYHLLPASMTFHGRDIFAPIAAYLSLGIPASDFGEPVTDLTRLPWPEAKITPRAIEGEIVYIDGFGNLITNIQERAVKELPSDQLSVSVGDFTAHGLAPNYAAGGNGDYIALINSWGLLEIALYKQNAQQRSRATIGAAVRVEIGSR